MSSILIWELLALNTYFEEIDFILLKWNKREAKNFKNLVVENSERLAKNPEIGNIIPIP
jgi:plasmid stabilization system protein ParE